MKPVSMSFETGFIALRKYLHQFTLDFIATFATRILTYWHTMV